MACFCGCETFEKHVDGKIVGCVKCNHGRQFMMMNGERLLEKMSDNLKNVILTLVDYSPMILTKTRLFL